ncbi:mitogen-activated protein kinase kinase kinase 15-like [Ochotona curzoniae]|uniref:mitogen-activated protein kinase kinase kinase 15-like n=1 Tax=Ochotona curzoniae TaxID=130825 RepID=UPI001B34EBD7|nr:mitogen-activated protein kinase kinase kinase 15-like [Ochotona curzoniae]
MDRLPGGGPQADLTNAAVGGHGATSAPVGQLHPSVQFNHVPEEIAKLLEHLIQRERDYQSFLQQTLEQKTQELYQLQLSTHAPAKDPGLSQGQRTQMSLLDWLKLQGADAGIIEKIVEEGYLLSAIPSDITKENLSHHHLWGGLLCQFWNALSWDGSRLGGPH